MKQSELGRLADQLLAEPQMFGTDGWVKDAVRALQQIVNATEVQGDEEVLKYVTSGNAVPVTRCTVSADLIRQLVSDRMSKWVVCELEDIPKAEYSTSADWKPKQIQIVVRDVRLMGEDRLKPNYAHWRYIMLPEFRPGAKDGDGQVRADGAGPPKHQRGSGEEAGGK